MRTNLPVTDNSVELSNDKSIVSKTDLKGLITYVNPYFMEVSGFTEDELIGAPQKVLCAIPTCRLRLLAICGAY